MPLKPAWGRRGWKWANSEKTIESQRQRDLTWHELRKQKQTRPPETQRQSIRRRMKERASLAGASGWLRLFNALINPLLKAMQRVSGFVLWPRDYSGINKGWAGNMEEIPPPLLCCLAIRQEAEMTCSKKHVSVKPCRFKRVKWTLEHTCTVSVVHVRKQKIQVTRQQSTHVWLFILWWLHQCVHTGHTEYKKVFTPLGSLCVFRDANNNYFYYRLISQLFS